MKSKPKPMLVGRSLKTLSPEEIDDLLAVAGVQTHEIGPSDGREEDEDGPSIHPTLPIFYRAQEGGEFGDPEKLIFTIWSKGEEDYSSLENTIEAGEVYCGWGASNVVAVVKWFLDHGWVWGVEPAAQAAA